MNNRTIIETLEVNLPGERVDFEIRIPARAIIIGIQATAIPGAGIVNRLMAEVFPTWTMGNVKLEIPGPPARNISFKVDSPGTFAMVFPKNKGSIPSFDNQGSFWISSGRIMPITTTMTTKATVLFGHYLDEICQAYAITELYRVKVYIHYLQA